MCIDSAPCVSQLKYVRSATMARRASYRMCKMQKLNLHPIKTGNECATGAEQKIMQNWNANAYVVQNDTAIMQLGFYVSPCVINCVQRNNRCRYVRAHFSNQITAKPLYFMLETRTQSAEANRNNEIERKRFIIFSVLLPHCLLVYLVTLDPNRKHMFCYAPQSLNKNYSTTALSFSSVHILIAYKRRIDLSTG